MKFPSVQRGLRNKRNYFLSSRDVLITRNALNSAGDQTSSEVLILKRTEDMISQILHVWPLPTGTEVCTLSLAIETRQQLE